MIDPTKYAEWGLLNKVNRHRLKLFSEGKFEVGIFEPEIYEITDHQTL